MVTKTTPLKRGYKSKEIDPKQLAALAGMQCTYEEIAAVFGIKKRQFIDRIQAESTLKEIIEDGWANGRASIRRQQFKMLMEGNATMAVWLGKQYLGQRDQASIEHAGPGGKPMLDLASVRAYLRSTPEEAEDCPTP